MTIRLQVFCTEQGCSTTTELDADDSRSWHWVAYNATAAHQPVACLRLVPPPHAPHPNGFTDPEEPPYVKLTRLAVLPEARAKGLARVLCDEAAGWAKKSKNEIGGGWDGLVLVHAQVGVEAVYEKLGFETDGRLGRWDEEGIEHLGMWRRWDLAA
jgi:predicted GNAT family N-acyltransferase